MKRIVSFALLAVLLLCLASCGSGRDFPLKEEEIRKILTLGALEKRLGQEGEINVNQRIYHDVECEGLKGTLYAAIDPAYDGRDADEIPIGYFYWLHEADPAAGPVSEDPATVGIREKLIKLYGRSTAEETDAGAEAESWYSASGRPRLFITKKTVDGEGLLSIQIIVEDE